MVKLAFELKPLSQSKLEVNCAPQASAFLTMYNMIHGSGHMPLHPPNTDNYALAAAGAFVE
eukprot:1158328-Pelagomonas_calceolata.AAC.7